MLTAVDISKEIKGNQVLSKVNISITPGEIIGVIGPSGSGKSTLIRNLSLLEIPDSGSVILNNRQFNFPLNQQGLPKNVHPNISVVFQQFHLWPHMTIEENLLMPLRQTNKKVDDNEFYELTTYFEIDHLLKRYPYQISVGQKQRSAFIRAILLRPEYLLLDEITNSLDIQLIGKLLNYIKGMASKGTGILVATHLIGFAADSCDRIVFLNDGKVIEDGGKSILKEPKTDLLAKFLTLLEYAR